MIEPLGETLGINWKKVPKGKSPCAARKAELAELLNVI